MISFSCNCIHSCEHNHTPHARTYVHTFARVHTRTNVHMFPLRRTGCTDSAWVNVSDTSIRLPSVRFLCRARSAHTINSYQCFTDDAILDSTWGRPSFWCICWICCNRYTTSTHVSDTSVIHWWCSSRHKFLSTISFDAYYLHNRELHKVYDISDSLMMLFTILLCKRYTTSADIVDGDVWYHLNPSADAAAKANQSYFRNVVAGWATLARFV